MKRTSATSAFQLFGNPFQNKINPGTAQVTRVFFIFLTQLLVEVSIITMFAKALVRNVLSVKNIAGSREVIEP